MSPPDTSLLERWQARHDASAFNEIVSRYTGMVYATCRRILKNAADAEDVTQECFLRLSQGDFEVRTSLGGWLHRVATNTSLTLLKSQARRRSREQRSSVDVSSADHDAPTWDEVQDHVDEAIDSLPEELRDVVTSHFLRRETYDAIARRLGTTRRKVSYRVEKGVEALRKRLRREGLVVAAPVLSALLSSNAAEAAPAGLLAVLGKLALVGTTRTPIVLTSAARQTDPSSATSPSSAPGWRPSPRWKPRLVVSVAASVLIVTGGVVLVRSFDLPLAEPTRVSSFADTPAGSVVPAEIPAPTEAEPTGVVKGRIRDAKTGELLGGARISVDDLESVADDDGNYVLTALAEGEHAVAVSAPGFTEKTVVVNVAGGGEAQVDVDLEPALVGLVGDVSGRPVAGAVVSLITQEYRPGTNFFSGVDELGRAAVGEDGTFQLTAPGDELLGDPVRRNRLFILATAPGYAYSVVSFANPDYHQKPFYDHERGQASEQLHFVLFPAVRLVGRVVDESKEPVTGAQVWIREIGAPVYTDESGRFVLEKVRPAPAGPIGSPDRVGIRHADFVETEVLVSEAGAPPVFVERESLVVETRTSPDIVLERGVLVEGRLSDVDTGEGLRGFGVNARWTGGRAHGYSDAEGRYSMRFAAVGSDVQIHPFVASGYGARSSNYFPVVAQATLSSEELDDNIDIDFEFRKGLSIRGRVIDSATGEAIARAFVEARPEGASESSYRVYWRRKSSSADEAGEFQIEGLKAGVYDLIVSVVSGGRTTKLQSERVELTTEAEPAELEVFVERKDSGEAVMLEGVAVSPDGAAVPFPVIRAYSHGVVTAHGDIDGHFTIACTAKWTAGGPIRVWDATRELYGVHALADCEEIRRPITVRLQPVSTIAGTVRDANGAPVSGMLVHVSVKRKSTSTPIVTASTDEEGRYLLTGYRPRPEDESVVITIREAIGPISRTAPRLIHGDKSYHRCAKLPVASSITGLDFRITDAQRVVAERR